MRRVTCAIVVAGLLLAADTAPAEIGTGGGSGGLDCTGAAAYTGVIWPPDHRMVAETITGVNDPYGSPTIVVTGIYQDEPVDALGSGNTAPDGYGVTTPTAYVRAERSGLGTGRIYFISYTASDPAGYTCSGSVPVYVPHDQGQGYTPVDTGQRYDSTMIPP